MDEILSLRDVFAIAALNGIIGSNAEGQQEPAIRWSPEDLAARAYAIADAMVAARKTTPKEEKTP